MRKMRMELHWRGKTINLTKIKMMNFISSLKAVFRKECTLWVLFFFRVLSQFPSSLKKSRCEHLTLVWEIF